MVFSEKKPGLFKLYKSGKIQIVSSMPEQEFEFDPETQIGEDAINLRLHPVAKKIKSDVKEINLLEDNTEQYLEEVILQKDGYRLKPGDILFCRSLEKIRITSRQHLGLMTGRPTVATYGLSVTLGQSKVPIDLPWNFPLHIRNNTERDIIIYPFINVVQLILLECTFGNIKTKKKNGKFNQSRGLFPGIIGDERTNLMAILGNWDRSKEGYDFTSKESEQEKKIRDNRKRYKLPIIHIADILYPIMIATLPVVFGKWANVMPDWVYISYPVVMIIIIMFIISGRPRLP